MLMIDNIKNYLYDRNYFINIYEDNIHVFNYIKMEDFSDNKVIFLMPNFKLIIDGKNFLITKMLENEILIRGSFLKMEKINA